MLNLEHLYYLTVFDACGTLSAAAEELNLSQPSLTRAMKALEDELQVTLFDRTKNKLSLNENGRYALDYAKRILSEADSMTEQIRALDRSRRTVTIGSCAPAPLWSLLPKASNIYSEMTISSEIRKDSDALIAGLRSHTYQLVVLAHEPDAKDLFCVPYIKERLYLSVPPAHRLASRTDGIYFHDFDGENIILFSDIGFWYDMHLAKLPHSRFLIQNKRFDFEELINSSVLPHFSTDLTLKFFAADTGRVHLPILDKEAIASYHLVCLKENLDIYQELM